MWASDGREVLWATRTATRWGTNAIRLTRRSRCTVNAGRRRGTASNLPAINSYRTWFLVLKGQKMSDEVKTDVDGVLAQVAALKPEDVLAAIERHKTTITTCKAEIQRLTALYKTMDALGCKAASAEPKKKRTRRTRAQIAADAAATATATEQPNDSAETATDEVTE